MATFKEFMNETFKDFMNESFHDIITCKTQFHLQVSCQVLTTRCRLVDFHMLFSLCLIFPSFENSPNGTTIWQRLSFA